MAKRKIAQEKEVLALFTAIMRGDISDYAVRKSSGGDEVVAVPPKVSDRSHAAELLAKWYGLFAEKEAPVTRSALAGEIEALAERLRGEESP